MRKVILLSGTTKPASHYITNNYYNNGPANLTTYVQPKGLAVGLNGDVFTFDDNAKVIRKTDINGFTTKFCGVDVFTSPSWANGFVDGNKDTTLFSNLTAICTDTSGNVYVIDNGKLRKIDPAGNCTTITGLAFLNAEGMFSRNNLVCVSDKANKKVVFVYPDGEISQGTTGFNNPTGVFGDTNGLIYVCDGDKVKKVVDGVVSVVASGFGQLSGITMDNLDNLLVTDTLNHQIKQIAPNGTVTVYAGSGFIGDRLGNVGTTRFSASFQSPTAIAIRSNGNVVVADTGNNKYKEIVP